MAAMRRSQPEETAGQESPPPAPPAPESPLSDAAKPGPIDGAGADSLGGPPPPAPPAPANLPPYSVAPGKSITCLRGHLTEGTEVFARDFQGGQDTLDDLVARGGVVKSS